MHPEIAHRKTEIAEICRRYGVVLLDEFGSAASPWQFEPEQSDADFLIKPEAVAGRQYLQAEIVRSSCASSSLARLGPG